MKFWLVWLNVAGEEHGYVVWAADRGQAITRALVHPARCGWDRGDVRVMFVRTQR